MTTTNDDDGFAVELCDAIRTIAARHGYEFQPARVNNDYSDDNPVFWDRLWASRGDVEHPDYRYVDIEFAICAPKDAEFKAERSVRNGDGTFDEKVAKVKAMQARCRGHS